MPTAPDTIHYINTFFARQPIFTRDQSVWGYQLLYRHRRESIQADYSDDDLATLSVIENALSSPQRRGAPGKKICIHFTQNTIMHDLPLTLPAENTIITIGEYIKFNEAYIASIRALKRKGYGVALDAYSGQEHAASLLDFVDVVFIDVLSKTPRQIMSIMDTAKYSVFGAKRVETQRHFDAINDLGFTYFHGFFFEEPTIVPGRKLTAGQVARLSLTRVLSSPEPDFEALSHVIETDVSLSYRLFTFVNSVHFGMKQTVSSIKRAVLLLGWDLVKAWLWLVVLTDLTPPGKTSELAYMALVRGRFLREMAFTMGANAHEAESWHLLGLFSMLEAMLDVPMETLVASLPVTNTIKDALTGSCGVMCDWLTMATCFESGDFDTLDRLAQQYGSPPLNMSEAYCRALGFIKDLTLPT